MSGETSGGSDGDSEVVLDLLGDPARPYKDPRGRKKLRINNALRQRVAVLAATGTMSQAQIAAAIGCCVDTLKAYFSDELEGGASAKKAAMIEALFDAGMSGNVTAMKAYIALCEKLGASPRAPARQPAAPKLGKKEQLARDAQKPLSGWGDLLPPQSMN